MHQAGIQDIHASGVRQNCRRGANELV